LLEEIEDHFEDSRFHLHRVEIPNPLGWMCDLGSVHQELFVTPHFHQHFNIEGLKNHELLALKLKFGALQLGM